LVILDIAEVEGEQTARAIRDRGGEAIFIHTNITVESSVAEAFDRGSKLVGQPDVLHNCAGGSTGSDGSLISARIEEFWRVVELDLLGTILCCRNAIPAMIEAGGGAIINMSSVSSLIGAPNMDFYTAAKGGVSALTRALALQHAPDNIRVNAIAPGVTTTERVLRRAEGNLNNFALMKKQIAGAAEPVDIAQAGLFLASDEARMITGVVLPVDGGATAW